MALTKHDLQAISEAVRPIVKEEINVLRVEMDKRFNNVHTAIDNAVAEILKTQGELHEDHEERIKALEHAQHTT